MSERREENAARREEIAVIVVILSTIVGHMSPHQLVMALEHLERLPVAHTNIGRRLLDVLREGL